jgi:hypothetical protein
MAKEKIKRMSGVFTSVFAHAGHITKEEAKDISGLAEDEFDEVYEKAGKIAENMMESSGNKMDKFLEHFAEEIEEFRSHYGGKIFE